LEDEVAALAARALPRALDLLKIVPPELLAVIREVDAVRFREVVRDCAVLDIRDAVLRLRPRPPDVSLCPANRPDPANFPASTLI